jgi:23S rRNA (guanosine2251-2'-O)-methyltransferase
MTAGFFRECSNPDCGFRFPDLNITCELAYCPKCGELAPVASRINSNFKKYNSSEYHREIIPLLDNIRSVYNVGSIIRTCEGFGIKEIILSGITPTPDHLRMNKTGLGTIPNIKWCIKILSALAASDCNPNPKRFTSVIIKINIIF